jgi:hypothetical protein
VIKKVLDSPFTGFAPWIVLSLLVGPGRFDLAAGLALALSIVIVGVDVSRQRSVKLLAVVDVVCFALFLAAGFIATAAQKNWLETWFGEISNIILVVVVVASMLLRRPFTMQYAKEETPPEHWSSPLFIRINYVITGGWAVAFLISAAVGYYGDAVLHNNNNLWTGWIIQTGADLVAVQFTSWYPRYAQARAVERGLVPADGPTESAPVAELLLGISAYLVPVGIISLAADGGPWFVGVGFIAAGSIITGRLRDRLKSGPADSGPTPVLALDGAGQDAQGRS